MSFIPSQTVSALPVNELPLLDLVSDMGMAVKGDSELKGWCNFHYSKDVYAFCGSDPDDPPKEDSYPMVEFFPAGPNYGREIERHERVVGMVCGIHDPEKKPVPYKGMDFQRGVIRLDEFCRMILAAISKIDLQGGYIATVDPEYDPENLFPFFLLGAKITIVKPI